MEDNRLIYLNDEPYLYDDILFKSDPETYIWQSEIYDFIASLNMDKAEEWRWDSLLVWIYPKYRLDHFDFLAVWACHLSRN